MKRWDEGVFQVVKDLGSVAAILIAFAYASGFIVVHVYLGRVGAVPFGLLSVQYLVAGVLFLCATCLVWAPIGAGKVMVRGLQPLLLNTAAYFFVVTAGWVLAGTVFTHVGVQFWDTVRWFSIAGTGLLILMSTTWRKITLLPQEPILMRMLFIGFVPSLLLWVGTATAFGTFVYPSISREFGGGRPVKFELRFAPDMQGPPSGDYDVLAITDRYWILRETSEEAFLLVPSEQVIFARLKERAGSGLNR